MSHCGTRRGYDLGCRCFPCRLSFSRYRQQWRETGGVRVPADRVRAHLQVLVESGWTRVGIAEAAGVGRTTPTGILRGRVHGRTSGDTSPPKLNPATAAALLAVPPLTDGSLRAHLRTLVRSGLTVDQIAAEAGLQPQTVAGHLYGRRAYTWQRTAVALASVRPQPDPIQVDVTPLWEAVRTHLPHMASADRRALYRGRRSGRISEDIADRIAIHAGVGPLVLIYPDLYEEAA